MSFLKRLTQNRYLLAIDVLLSVFAYVFVIFLIYPASFFAVSFMGVLPCIVITAVVFVATLLLTDIYRIYWVHGSRKEYARLLLACFAAYILSMIVDVIFLPQVWTYLKLNLASKLVYTFLVLALRFFVRILPGRLNSATNNGGKRVLIIGAGRLGAKLLRDIRDNQHLHYTVVGLIDDDQSRHNQIMLGTKILGGRDKIIKICRTKRVEEIIFAIYSLEHADKQAILEICSETGCTVKIMPAVQTVLSGEFSLNSMRHVEIEDLLERDPVQLNNDLIRGDIAGKVVLVTGGGGSIGSELCRQIIQYKPKLLLVVDIYENTTYELQNELEEKYPEQEMQFLIASIRDKKRLEDIFAQYCPDMVFHAAAHKHVPLMEYSPCEAVKNNVFGTYNVAKCADQFGVKRFVMISTDKAVNPTNVMGATKRMCEMIIQTMAVESKTDFVAVRFGNVLGSNGSVIPRFENQIAAGGPVTVTHPEITRFFMTIPEAARLVLQAGASARGGEIFVLDMGKPVKIYDLAKKLIRLSGYRPDVDIKIAFTGLRPGEKLYEELLMNEEGLKKTEHSKIFIGSPIAITSNELQHKLQVLNVALAQGNDAVKVALKEVVPTFVPEKAQVSVEDGEQATEMDASVS